MRNERVRADACSARLDNGTREPGCHGGVNRVPVLLQHLVPGHGGAVVGSCQHTVRAEIDRSPGRCLAFCHRARSESEQSHKNTKRSGKSFHRFPLEYRTGQYSSLSSS